MKTKLTCLVSLFFLASAALPIHAQADDPALIRTFEGHTSVVFSVAFSPDGRYALSGSHDKTLKLWEVSTGRLIRTFKGHSGYVYSVAFSPDGRYALSGSRDKTIKLWEVSTGRMIRTFKGLFRGHSSYVTSVAFAPDGRYALSGSLDKTLKLWDMDTGRLIRTFAGHSEEVRSVAFSPDGRYALSGSDDGTLKLWEVSSGREIRTFKINEMGVNSVAFSPDGHYALSGGRDATLTLSEVLSGQEIRIFKRHAVTIISVRGPPFVAVSVALSSDGQYALSGGGDLDDTVKLWEVSSGRLVRILEGHIGDVSSIAFSPDGRYALSGSVDKTLKLWDVSTWTKPEEAPPAKTDKTPPIIQITAPTITRGMKKVQQEKTVLVKGKATDASGIFEVQVNQQDAELDALGNFWAEVRLKVGDNNIYVKATDIHGNEGRTSFTVVREAIAGPEVEVATITQGGKLVTPEGEELRPFNQSWAIVVGIDDYRGNVPTLRHAVKDAKEVATMLKDDIGFQSKYMIELYNRDATRENILKSFDRVSNQSERDDRLLVFFAGHGITKILPTGREKGYILPYDADIDRYSTTCISTDQLNELSEIIPAKHLYFVMDACYGGTLFTRAKALSPKAKDYLKAITSRITRQAITAGGRDQEVLDSGPGGHSVFTYHFLEGIREGLADMNSDGIITASELAAYVSPEVTSASRMAQTPEYGHLSGSKGGEFIFVRKR